MSEFVDDLPDIDGLRSPRFCRQLIGQDASVSHFLSNLAQGKLHHACLLTGPKGVGKASFAHMAARFMLHHNDPVSAAKNAENLSVLDIAKMVYKKITSEIAISETNDIRSYRQNSDKLLSTGFSKKFNIQEAINDMHQKFIENKIKDKNECYTVKWMKELKL